MGDTSDKIASAATAARGDWTSATTVETSLNSSEQQPPLEPVEDVPPNGGYGWVCVACVFGINAHTWGLNGVFGVFLAHYLSANTFPGTSALKYALIGGLSVSQALLIGPVTNILTRKFGTRLTLLLGVFLQTISLVGASFSSKVWHLFLSQGICFGWGMGLLFTGSVGIPPQWFTTRRSLANGVSTAGSGVGGVVYSLAAGAMIKNLGLPWTFRLLAVVSCAVNLPCSLLLRDRNKKIGMQHLAFDFTLFGRIEFNLLLGWGIFSMLGYTVLQFSIPDYALSIGLSSFESAIIAAVLSLGQAIGRPLVGYFSDSFGRTTMAAVMTFMPGLLCLVFWAFAKSYASLIACSLVLGLVCGTFWSTIGPVGADIFGLKILPNTLSIIWVLLAFPATGAEPIAMALKRKTGNKYLYAQIFTGVMYCSGALCMWALRSWKYSQVVVADNAAMARGEKEGTNEQKASVWRGLVSLRKL